MQANSAASAPSLPLAVAPEILHSTLVTPALAAPQLHAQQQTSLLLPCAAPAQRQTEMDDENEDLGAWIASMEQTIAATDVTQPYQLKKCFRGMDYLRDAIARGAPLHDFHADACGLAHALHGLLEQLVRHVEAGVVDLRIAGPDATGALCSGLGLLAELSEARAFNKADRSSLPVLVSQLGAVLIDAVKAAPVAADAQDAEAMLNLLTWLTRALKARLLFSDNAAVRVAFSHGIDCMRVWTALPESDGMQRKAAVLNACTLAICFVQLNTIRQYQLLHLDGASDKAKANRRSLQAALKSLCAALPDLLNSNGVQLANVCNTLKDYVDAGLLSDDSHGWLMPAITLLLQRMPQVPRAELMQRGGQALANYANFLRMLFETGLHMQPAFVGCAIGYRQACAWLTGLLAQDRFSLRGRLDQSLANLMSFVKAMARLADRPARTQDAEKAKEQKAMLKRAAQRLIDIAQAHLLAPQGQQARLSPKSIAGMLLALWEFQGRAMAAAAACQPLMRRLLQAIPESAGADWESETVAMCLRAMTQWRGPGDEDGRSMRAAFERLLPMLGKSPVANEAHRLYCLQALHLGLQEKWTTIDASPLQKALRNLLAWKRSAAPTAADLRAAVAALAHREETIPVMQDDAPSPAQPHAPHADASTDTSCWIPPGGKLAALTADPALKASTTYRAPLDTAGAGRDKPLKPVKGKAATKNRKIRRESDEDEDDASDPMQAWFLLAGGARRDEEVAARMAELAALQPELLNMADAGGNTALHYAIVSGNRKAAQWLMAQPGLSPHMPRQAFLDRLAEGLLDSPKPKQAKQLYEEFRAASREDEDEKIASTSEDKEPSPRGADTRDGRADGPAHPQRTRKPKANRGKDKAGAQKGTAGKQSARTLATDAPVQNAVDAHLLGRRYADGEGVEQNAALAFEWIGKAAEQGHAEAQNDLAMLYMRGLGVERNPVLACAWLGKSAAQGNVLAQCNLARLYLDGVGVERNETLGVQWLSKAAVRGQADAQVALADCYLTGTGVKADVGRAFRLLGQAADGGNADAQARLGTLYRDGRGVRTNMPLAIHWFSKAAAMGSALAQSCLGMAYLNGSGVKKDPPVAIQWLVKAAEQGLPDAQHNLGTQYLDGNGVEKNETLAFFWISKAAEQGASEAQQTLGYMYCGGHGVKEDHACGVHWTRLAAEQGLDSAQLELGLIYLKGKYAARDEALAFHWISLAAEQGLVTAMNHLAELFLDGRGVPKDAQRAFAWFTKAAATGDGWALYRLALLHMRGQGTRKSLEHCLIFLKLAAEKGEPAAQQALENVPAILAAKTARQ